jgi:hypothetical protein
VPLKNLFWNSTQCSLRVCRKHSRVSIHISTPKVKEKNIKNRKNSKMQLETP